MCEWQPRQSAEITQQQIGNETLLLDGQGKTVHVLNATALTIWECCDGNHTIPQIEAALREQFAVSAETPLTKDIDDALSQFHKKGLVT